MIALDGEPSINLRALFTPGHARGHLCFYDERTGALTIGDNVVGFGSVLIDPADGNMRDYLASLARMRALPNLSVLFGGHGPPIANPYEKIDEYIAHRLQRERADSGRCTRRRIDSKRDRGAGLHRCLTKSPRHGRARGAGASGEVDRRMVGDVRASRKYVAP